MANADFFKPVNRALLRYVVADAADRLGYTQGTRRAIEGRIRDMSDEQVDQALADWPR